MARQQRNHGRTSQAKGRVVQAAGAALGALALMATVGTGTANAGPQHHGTDPAATGCNAQGAAIASRTITTMNGATTTVVLYYSSLCQTNWIRVASNPLGGAAVKRISAEGRPALPDEVDFGHGSSYSMQVYAPGSTCVNFSVTLLDPAGFEWAQSGSHRIC
ncbi:DUF2690 domain-containing protein [Streptomyces microflavus]